MPGRTCRDLNNLKTSGDTTVEVIDAAGINDASQIAGTGTPKRGKNMAVLLTPQ
jgi:hypothetical protein